MRKLSFLLMLVSFTSLAQIKGNKTIETRTFTIENVEVIKINFYAKVKIDQSAKEGMTITTDSNLFEHIDKEVVDGTLHLDQLKWISPSEDEMITIGAPNLKRVETGTHDETKIINVNTDFLNIMAPVGDVTVEGKTKELHIGIEQGKVDAGQLVSEKARVNIWGWGKAIVKATDELYTKLNDDATLEVIGNPKKLKGDAKKAITKSNRSKDTSIKWISFKIKNNSWNRNQFVVVGPKEDGSKFSYGFPMMPGFTKKERWTTGTKIYKVNKIGLRKLLVKIKPEYEGKTINLF